MICKNEYIGKLRLKSSEVVISCTYAHIHDKIYRRLLPGRVFHLPKFSAKNGHKKPLLFFF